MTTILYYATSDALLRTVAEAAAILHDRYDDAPQIRMFALVHLDDPEAKEHYLRAAAEADIAVIHRGGGDDRVPFPEEFAAVTGSIPVVMAPRSGPVEVLHRTVDAEELVDLRAYLDYGGLDNTVSLLERLMARFGGASMSWSPPVEVPWEGVYHPRLGGFGTIDEYFAKVHDPHRWTAAIWLHRSHAVTGNVEVVDALVAEIEAQGGNALPIFLILIHDEERHNLGYQELIDQWLLRDGVPVADVLINLMIMPFGFERRFKAEPRPDVDDGLARLGIPVLKAVLSSIDEEEWHDSARGLSPLNLVTQYVYPEFAGNLTGTIVGFRDDSLYDPITDSYQTRYRPHAERIGRLVAMARRWARLRRTPPAERRVALVLHNYPPRDDTIASASGLDAPESALRLLGRMREAGYEVGDLPADSAGLMDLIKAAATNDYRWRDSESMAENAVAIVATDDYRRWFETLPAAFRARVLERWGRPEDALVLAEGFPVTGVRFGNVLVTVQPVRAFGEDAASILHDPDVPVPHHYVAAYQWIRHGFGAHAAIHLGTHGSLEWLPGKAIGLSGDCDPDVTLGELPNLYPYIVNNPGEGTQAKRRGNAAIISHLPPAVTTAGAYEELEALDQAIDDYREAADFGSARALAVAERIWQLVQDAHLDQDLEIDRSPIATDAVEDMVGRVDNYLGFLKETQITTGLHVLGSGPAGDRLAEYLVALTRQSRAGRPSLRTLALDLAGRDLTLVLKEPGAVHRTADGRSIRGSNLLDLAQDWSLELMGAVAQQSAASVEEIVTAALGSDTSDRLRAARPVPCAVDEGSIRSALDVLVREVRDELLPRLRCDGELTSILDGLDGRRIAPGASGAPTAGSWSMLPTGRNFYAVNPLSLPSREAWAVGQQLAADLLQRYRADHDDYPADIGFDLRAIPEMRTKGEDVAEILALLGVRPVHQDRTPEVSNVEVIPLAELGRPRIDVTVRMCGLFRDTFPNLITLLDKAVQAVAFLDEPAGMNFVAEHVRADLHELRTLGLPDRTAERRASYRLFGSKPGAYGAGPNRLIEEKAWEHRSELGNIYIEFGAYVYTAEEFGRPDVDGFVRQLGRVDAAVRNIDTREVDLLSCSHQYGHFGGMVAAVETVRGFQPVAYMGDTSDHARLATRTLREEMKIQLRSKIVNPKWIASMQEHGYKGAGEIAEKVDRLFGWDATAEAMDDWMYDNLAERFVQDEQVRHWMEEVNPHAQLSVLERLLEAHQRGMWNASPELIEELQSRYLESEGDVEAKAVAAL